MAGSLRELAGDAFRDVDVISAFHTPLTPEQLVLDRYVFLPHSRTGIAAALTTPFSWAGKPRATVAMKVPVVDDRGSLDAEMTVHVYGPADVTEIDPRQVVRAFPRADSANAEVDDLVHVEFDRPDLPWLFTPAAPDADGRLVPWLTLVVAEARHVAFGERRGAVRRASVRRDQLQPLGDAWAWAHAQVMGAKGADASTEPTLEQRLSEANAAHNLSRLVCPRRLDDHTAYVACVVPTFEVGRQAGLGLSTGDTLAPAWGTAADFGSGDPASTVELPVYYAWSFATGEEGNFESLAHKLKPRVAPPGVGRRRVDTTHPWLGDPETRLGLDDPGAEMVVEGPVVSPQKPEDSPEEEWPTEARQHYDQPVIDALVAKLNNPDVRAEEDDDAPPLVGPPLYGGNHAQQRRIQPGQPAWFDELNVDPRNRIVGGVATRVVQAEQEQLMAAAWNQVVGVEQANRALRLAQLARHVSARLHGRHLSRLSDAAIMSVTERVHAKVLDAPERSVWARLEESSLPTAVTLGAFRRLTRLRGPVVRTSVAAVELRASAVEALSVRGDRLTTDWVRVYADPDGITGVGAVAGRRLTPEIADRVAPGLDPGALVQAWNDELAGPGLVEALDPDRLARVDGHDVRVEADTWAALTRRVLVALPGPEEMFSGPDEAVTAAPNGFLLRALLRHARDIGIGEIEISRRQAKRHGLEGHRGKDRTRVLVEVDAFEPLAARAVLAARELQVEGVPYDEYEGKAERLLETLRGSAVLPGRQVVAGLDAIAAKLVGGADPFTDRVRERVDVPALELVTKLDPGTTVPARVRGRLTAGSGRVPTWLRPDWFDDLRIEPVMAHPHFAWPMYEPLHRWDPEWMVPGLGLIERPDMATLLETNNQFVEAYLVGLNHEMGRELLWREYPTDQRGTYFDSFWTGRPELTADLHELPWRTGSLGSHLAGPDQRLVFLVRGDLIRRYPGAVAHAAREADREGGVPIFEATSPVETLFHVFLPPNVLLVGFDMTRARIDTAGETWWFTLSENPTEPRFGLDPSREGGLSRDNLIWDDFGVTLPGQFLDATRNLPLVDFPPNRWGTSSAQVASLLFQLPARAAFLGRRMVDGAVPHG